MNALPRFVAIAAMMSLAATLPALATTVNTHALAALEVAAPHVGQMGANPRLMLNPQPLPPRAIAPTGPSNGLSKVALNPQPIPPGHADILHGNQLFQTGDYNGAAQAYQRAASANPSDAVAVHNIALAHFKLGLTSQASTEMNRSLSLARSSGDTTTATSAANVIHGMGTSGSQ